MTKYVKAIIAVMAGTSIFCAFFSDAFRVGPQAQLALESQSKAVKGQALSGSVQLLSLKVSPFAKGQPSPPPHAETVDALKDVLKKTGLRTPDRYYDLGYKALRELADKGDIYANIQLGARYLFTREALEYDPDYDFTVNPKAEAFKSFSNAAALGSTSSMAMLSTKLADVNPIDSYAWKMLSSQLSPDAQREFYTRENVEFHLTSEEIAKAKARSEQLLQQLISRPLAPLPQG